MRIVKNYLPTSDDYKSNNCLFEDFSNNPEKLMELIINKEHLPMTSEETKTSIYRIIKINDTFIKIEYEIEDFTTYNHEEDIDEYSMIEVPIGLVNILKFSHKISSYFFYIKEIYTNETYLPSIVFDNLEAVKSSFIYIDNINILGLFKVNSILYFIVEKDKFFNLYQGIHNYREFLHIKDEDEFLLSLGLISAN